MSLNKFMHPRNLYKNNKPDFKKLALEHENFRKVAKQSMDGKVSIDFRNAACLKALSEALLLSDFALSVDLPEDRLIPAVPQRLNYILWIEDLLKDTQKERVTGIDIGCGASCIYALLGHKLNNWHFIATELDTENFNVAQDNIKRNGYTNALTVLKQDGNTLLKMAVDYHNEHGGDGVCIDFSMSNPPFFSTDESAVSRGDRAEAKHVSTASQCEKMVEGGEVEFVKKMIDESLSLRHKIRIYTSLVGKKSSVSKLKQYLKEKSIHHISTTEFCQGRTMRWAIAWTFDDSVVFPKSLFQQERCKVKAGFVHTISPDINCCVYDVPAITHYVKSILLTQLEMKTTTLHQDVDEFVCMVVATKNNWSNSRRKRRAEKRKQEANNLTDEETSPLAKKHKPDPEADKPAANQDVREVEQSADEMSSSDEKPLITFSLEVKLEGIHIKLHMNLVEGEQKDMLHQILQYLKNRLA